MGLEWLNFWLIFDLMRTKGLEPSHLTVLEPKSSASANSATSAISFDGALCAIAAFAIIAKTRAKLSVVHKIALVLALPSTDSYQIRVGYPLFQMLGTLCRDVPAERLYDR